MTEQFANNASTTLNGAITNSATSIAVTNGTPFSQSGTFRVIVDSEIMLVNSISGNTLSVTRGQEGTTAVSHLSGATITQIVTAGAIAQLKTDLTTTGVMHSGSGNPNTTPSFVQGVNAGGNGSLVKPTTAASVTAGNLLVVFQQCENSGTTGTPPTDNIGTSYASVVSVPTGSSQVVGTVYAGVAPSSAIVTVNPTQGTSFNRTSIGEYKNATTTVDSTNTVVGATNNVNVSPTAANSLVLGIVGDFSSSATFVAGANMTANFSGNGNDSTFYESAVPSAAGTFNVAYTTAVSGNILLAAVFHPATVAATVGNDGDFYIDTTNRVLYGPRAAGFYPRIGSLSA